MSRLIVIGGGGHGRVVADSARGLDVYDTIVFLDDAPDRMMDDGEFTVIGSCLLTACRLLANARMHSGAAM